MAAKPKVPSVKFGPHPDPTKVQQAFPGVSTQFLPHEALIVYTDKITSERKAFQTNASKQWFREHKRKQKEEERVAQVCRDVRAQKRREAEEHVRRSASTPGLTLPPLA
eukprot:TRINITY_DN34141_c0_g1_i1.p1 TRINITY_DN34141_c0_g1~~TRINITY_DN34141_c0_g1_i1.p1  ORF type:complete len:109 (-),score=25.30 TRINITY_DN34141_c0_g1_i1:317-643(-)